MTLIVADESVDRPIIVALREAGFSVIAIAEVAPSTGDPEVLAQARGEEALLLTMDSDFGELIHKRGFGSPKGIVFVRNKKLSLISAIRKTVTVFRAERVEGNYITISRTATRSKPLPDWSA